MLIPFFVFVLKIASLFEPKDLFVTVYCKLFYRYYTSRPIVKCYGFFFKIPFFWFFVLKLDYELLVQALYKKN